jgi:hypothetical protein
MMRSMDAVRELRLLLLSRHRLIFARADDETRFMGYLRQAAAGSGMPVWTWSATRGLARDGLPPQANTRTAAGAIAFVAEVGQPSVFVLHDVEDALAEPTTVRAIKERAMEAAAAQTLILTGPTIEVPDDLRGSRSCGRWSRRPGRRSSGWSPRRSRSSASGSSRAWSSPRIARGSSRRACAVSRSPRLTA